LKKGRKKVCERSSRGSPFGLSGHDDQSLNNILWDKKRTVLDITNETAAKNFTDILPHGVAK
jgi:hypothetical protein